LGILIIPVGYFFFFLLKKPPFDLRLDSGAGALATGAGAAAAASKPVNGVAK
jgi:hypothetical protein